MLRITIGASLRRSRINYPVVQIAECAPARQVGFERVPESPNVKILCQCRINIRRLYSNNSIFLERVQHVTLTTTIRVARRFRRQESAFPNQVQEGSVLRRLLGSNKTQIRVRIESILLIRHVVMNTSSSVCRSHRSQCPFRRMSFLFVVGCTRQNRDVFE